MRSPFLRVVIWIVTFLAACAGTFASSYLAYRHATRSPTPTTQPATTQAQDTPTTAPEDAGFLDELCTTFAHSDCEKVNESPWGRFPFGTPPGRPSVSTAELGLVYFIFVLCWMVLIGYATRSRFFVYFLYLMVTAAGLGASAFLDVVMWTQLDVWCPYCLAAHVASLLIFVGTLLLWPRSPRAIDRLPMDLGEAPPQIHIPKPWPTFRAVFAMLVAFVLATAGQHVLWLNLANIARIKSLSGSECQKQIDTYKSYSDFYKKQFRRYDDVWQIAYMSWVYEPAIPVVTDGEPFRGPPDAAHTLVLFSDIQCPACGQLDERLERYIIPASLQFGAVKIIYKHYPLCPDCNPYATHNLHPQACLGAQAMEAGLILDGSRGFWRMHDWLGARRAEMKGAKKEWFVKEAVKAGFDGDAFAQAMDSEQALNRIRAHIEEAQQLGKGYVPAHKLEDYKVSGTPTLILDNRIMRTWRHHKAWVEALRKPAPPPPGGVNEPRQATTAPMGP